MTTSNYDTVVIDYKTGNVDSVIKAVKLYNNRVILSNDPNIIIKAKRLILPGQGSFDFGMKKLNEFNLIELIKELALVKKLPILGICLGMQVLADMGYENKKTNGLGLINGEIIKIPTTLKLPHVGWNEVVLNKDNFLTSNIKNKTDFYFVHTYFFRCKKKNNVIGTSFYGTEFPTIVNEKNIFGVQFHPEKSLNNGLKIISNFLKL